MTRLGQRIAGLVAALGLLALVGCTPIVRNHGYVPSDDDLAAIQVGEDTRATVTTVIGRPSAAGLMSDGAFFYVRSRRETVAWRAPQEVDRQVVAISFDADGVVENIERFTLDDGQVVTLSRRVTSTNIRNVTLIRQLLSSLGRIRADQFVD